MVFPHPMDPMVMHMIILWILYDGLPLSYGSYDGLPLSYGSYDVFPYPMDPMMVFPYPMATSGLLS